MDNPEIKTGRPQTETYPKKLRRGFLKNPVIAGTVSALAAVGATLSPMITSIDSTPQDRQAMEYRMQSDQILSGEELAQAGIHIYNTDTNKLELKRSVFNDFALFKDAKDGKVGVNIILVDGTLDQADTSVSELAGRALSVVTPNQKQDLSGRLGQYFSFTENAFQELENSAKKGDQGATEELQRYEAAIAKDPGLKNQVFIFLSFGVDPNIANPNKSYPQPENIPMRLGEEQNRPTDNPDLVGPHPYQTQTEGDKYIVNTNAAGIGEALAHEVHHYEGDSETMTDERAYWSVKEAADKMRGTGDKSGYPFIFTTPKGKLFSRVLPQENQPTAASKI